MRRIVYLHMLVFLILKNNLSAVVGKCLELYFRVCVYREQLRTSTKVLSPCNFANMTNIFPEYKSLFGIKILLIISRKNLIVQFQPI